MTLTPALGAAVPSCRRHVPDDQLTMEDAHEHRDAADGRQHDVPRHADARRNKLTLKPCHPTDTSTATDTSTGTVCSTVLQQITATDAMLVGVLIGTESRATQQYRVDNFATRAR
jgi:hypothetical protein